VDKEKIGQGRNKLKWMQFKRESFTLDVKGSKILDLYSKL